MTTFDRVAFLKPLNSNATVKVPIGTLGNWYVPLADVVETNGRCRAGPLTVTVTPGSTPPDGSVTLPKIEPIAWALANPAVETRMPAASRMPRKTRVICPPPNYPRTRTTKPDFSSCLQVL